MKRNRKTTLPKTAHETDYYGVRAAAERKATLNDARDRDFAAGLAKCAGVKKGQPVLFLKHEHPYVVATYYETREAYIAGDRGDTKIYRRWITYQQAVKIAKQLKAALVEF